MSELPAKVGDKVIIELPPDEARRFWVSKVTWFTLEADTEEFGKVKMRLVLKSIEVLSDKGIITAEIELNPKEGQS